jgi:hypothetical protein
MNALYDERLNRCAKLIEMKLDRDAFNKFETRYQDESQANIENIASLSSLQDEYFQRLAFLDEQVGLLLSFGFRSKKLRTWQRPF